MWRMWTGVAFGGLAMLTFLFRFSSWQKLYLISLAVSMVMMTVSAHFGASSVHGAEYLTKYAPKWVQKMLGEEPKPQAVVAPPGVLTADTVFAKAIQPMLTARCASCHGAEKAKGGLDITSLMTACSRSGEDGPGVVAGQPAGKPCAQADGVASG